MPVIKAVVNGEEVEIKYSFVSKESMEKDLNPDRGEGSGRGRSLPPELQEVVDKIKKLAKPKSKGKALKVDMTPQQRSNVLGKGKADGLIQTRKEPNRPISVKHKVLKRDESNKPIWVRTYFVHED